MEDQKTQAKPVPNFLLQTANSFIIPKVPDEVWNTLEHHPISIQKVADSYVITPIEKPLFTKREGKLLFDLLAQYIKMPFREEELDELFKLQKKILNNY